MNSADLFHHALRATVDKNLKTVKKNVSFFIFLLFIADTQYLHKTQGNMHINFYYFFHLEYLFLII